jgi:type II secretory pathway component PulC
VAVGNLSRDVDDLRVRNRDLETEVQKLTKQVAFAKQSGAPLPAEVPVLPTVDLSGVVNGVDAEHSLAEINLGSRDKVVTTTPFIVSRDGKYLADLVVEKVDENSSVGHLKTVQGEIRKGDHVTYTVKR